MVNNNVRAKRQEHNLTQETLAGKVDVSRQTIIALEKGNYTPSVKLALLLAQILDTTVEMLFWLDDKEQ
jgi:putative transcriptional regulator